jgi:hypothetical protein
MYAIRRMKRDVSAWCWAVDFTRRGDLQSKRFYDGTYGGSKQALAAARTWRDNALAQMGVFTHREFCEQRRSNNTSGVPGVHFLRPTRQPAGIWQARIKVRGGRKMHRTFSVRRFGEQEAFRLAVATRADLLRLVDEQPYLKHPTAKRLVKERWVLSGIRSGHFLRARHSQGGTGSASDHSPRLPARASVSAAS